MNYHVAEFNVGTMRGPLHSAVMANFWARYNEINAIADDAPGFVWRLEVSEAEATSIPVDNVLMINMSVWENIEALHQFTYSSRHVELYRQGADWFDKMDIPILVLWWVPVGHIPSPEEGRTRLVQLMHHGPTPLAFTFKERFTIEEMLAYPSDL